LDEFWLPAPGLTRDETGVLPQKGKSVILDQVLEEFRLKSAPTDCIVHGKARPYKMCSNYAHCSMVLDGLETHLKTDAYNVSEKLWMVHEDLQCLPQLRETEELDYRVRSMLAARHFYTLTNYGEISEHPGSGTIPARRGVTAG